ncbi:MAG: glycerol-3-phosphate 1-O-acyltransferase PlsY [bacterium]|jgi:glycerol-3-phosphate acyltransferase PlsY
MDIFFILLIISYILGSIPFGYVIAKLRGIDITKVGSKNIGMANVFRNVGPIYGIIVLFLDSFKGFLPTFIAINYKLPDYQVLIIGLASIIGHSFTIFLKFKGGKGVATSFGVFLAISPLISIIGLIIWIISVLISRYSSLGSILAASFVLFISLVYLFFNLKFNLFGGNYKNSKLFLVSLIIVSFIILLKHRDNFIRIIQGKENKLF